ncbi:hypothetical protein [Terrabacter sp. MAHUQ-38]|uniref:hypothetical protein n=1 Tax=unclassified Terrabacter TaxID=2630222 RepID=UPI00165EA43A|nr:hypothetical protein [Terrabacter sp. MAHUQ-38]MBC9819695.1 hypothetical protein [Terrabacter sp. MAHUQ-38]
MNVTRAAGAARSGGERSRGLGRWISFQRLGTLAWVVILLLSAKGQHDYGRGWGYAVPLVAGAALIPWFFRVLERQERMVAMTPVWVCSLFGGALGATIAYIESTARADWPLERVLLAVAAVTVAGAVAAPWLIRRTQRR